MANIYRCTVEIEADTDDIAADRLAAVEGVVDVMEVQFVAESEDEGDDEEESASA